MFKFIISKDVEKNVTDEYIDSIEKSMNIKFPSILREYYLKHNFCKNKECCFEMYGVEFILDCIIPLKYGNISL